MKAIMSAFWATALFVMSIPAAGATPQLETRSATVNYSDLDLTRAQGVSTLQQRVSGAAHQVCGRLAVELHEPMQRQACEAAAQKNANKAIESAVAGAKPLPSISPESTAKVAAAKSLPTIASGQIARRSIAGAKSVVSGQLILQRQERISRH